MVIAVLVAGFTAIGVTLALVGVKFDGGYPDANYALTQPKTLLDGRYKFSKNLSDTSGQRIEKEANTDWDVRDPRGVVGLYTLDGDAAKGTLSVSGMDGRFKNVDSIRRRMMTPVTEDDKEDVAESAQDFTPDGAGITVSCEVISSERTGTAMTYPLCAWADDNTAACVALITSASMGQDPSDVDLEAAARTTVQVRSETRKAIK
ncbi:hypothetical protein ACIRU3_44810 [Streptomyces sp. NPDC101151]|uniref:hypothetical protein n=1 Tax=Streptomyces sp. NPDC101151 TaxID=3366115 RepID=UPI0037F20FF3